MNKTLVKNRKKMDHSIVALFLSRTIGLIITIVFFALAVWFTNLDLSDGVSIAFIAFVLGLLVDRLSGLGAELIEQDKAEKRFAEIQKGITNSFNIEKLSSDEEALTYLADRLVSAVNVENTFVGSSENLKSRLHTDHSVIDLYSIFFNSKGQTWIDIVSINELSSNRFNKIPVPSIEGISHKVILLRHNVPTLNFILVDYGRSEKEVIFGWSYASSMRNKELFRSQDAELVDLFQNYFNALQSYKSEEFLINYDGGKTLRARLSNRRKADRGGHWVTIGYDRSGIISLARFDISFQGREVSIQGLAYWKTKYADREQKFGIEMINHDKRNVTYSAERIFLEYGNPASNRKGICVYNFFKDDGQIGNLPEERLEGYLHDDGFSERVQILGIKVYPSATQTASSNDEYILKYRDELNDLSTLIGYQIDWESFGLEIGGTT
ncbi:hypothetical protein [uncultured Roseobacter sp.]|uniref:hypothetical protein n=1 Tax=uncultured Roseobacter sp. TaxID=114847 RepID=UPI0026138265|nr:hypothetical protein [uncultured Roseobacter sp.]